MQSVETKNSSNQTIGYPNPSIPLVPTSLKDLEIFCAHVRDYLPPPIPEKYSRFSDLNIDAWEDLGSVQCYILGEAIKGMAPALNSLEIIANKPVGISVHALGELQLSARTQNALRRARSLRSRAWETRSISPMKKSTNTIDLEHPTFANLLAIRNFGWAALLEVIGRLEATLGSDHSIELEQTASPDYDEKSEPRESINHQAKLPDETSEIPVIEEPINPTGGDPKDVWSFLKGQLDEREFFVIEQRWLEDKTLQELGETLGITRERVRQIEKKAINKMRHPVKGLMRNGLEERLRWVEAELCDLVASRGGLLDIDSFEAGPDWSIRGIWTWIAFNAFTGVLNPTQKSFGKSGEFGRLQLADGCLALFQGHSATKDQDSLSNIVEKVIGPTRIMRLEDLLRTLDRQPGSLLGSLDLATPVIRGEALHRAGLIYLLEATFIDELRSGRWVSVGLGHPAREIARAILYGCNNDHTKETGSVECFRHGLRSDMISRWLEANSDHQAGSRTVDSLCARYPLVFVRTNATSWGLVGAGAEAQALEEYSRPSSLGLIVNTVLRLRDSTVPVTKKAVAARLSGILSAQWVSQIIDRALANGYLVDISKSNKEYDLSVGIPIPVSDQNEVPTFVRNTKRGRGTVSQLVLQALKSKGQGLTEEEVLRYARDKDPDISAITISIYLKSTFDWMIEKTSTGRYRLISTDKRLVGHTNDATISTIGILRAVLRDSAEPIPVSEIVARCRSHGDVNISAVRGYLAQNYMDLFVRDKDGRYALA